MLWVNWSCYNRRGFLLEGKPRKHEGLLWPGPCFVGGGKVCGSLWIHLRPWCPDWISGVAAVYFLWFLKRFFCFPWVLKFILKLEKPIFSFGGNSIGHTYEGLWYFFGIEEYLSAIHLVSNLEMSLEEQTVEIRKCVCQNYNSIPVWRNGIV